MAKDESAESMLAAGKARASGRGEPKGYSTSGQQQFARGGRVSKKEMEAVENSPADQMQDTAEAMKVARNSPRRANAMDPSPVPMRGRPFKRGGKAC